MMQPLWAPVAQLDRASDYGSEGREFESLRARFFHHDQVNTHKKRPEIKISGLFIVKTKIIFLPFWLWKHLPAYQ